MNFNEIDWKQIENNWKEIAEENNYFLCETCCKWLKNLKQHYKSKKHGKFNGIYIKKPK